MLLTILIIITAGILLTGIVSIINSWRDHQEIDADMISVLGLCLLVVIVFGWVLLGMGLSAKRTITEVSGEVLHDKISAHVSVAGDVVATYKDIATFQFLEERKSVRILRVDHRNMYGITINTTWELSNNQ